LITLPLPSKQECVRRPKGRSRETPYRRASGLRIGRATQGSTATTTDLLIDRSPGPAFAGDRRRPATLGVAFGVRRRPALWQDARSLNEQQRTGLVVPLPKRRRPKTSPSAARTAVSRTLAARRIGPTPATPGALRSRETRHRVHNRPPWRRGRRRVLVRDARSGEDEQRRRRGDLLTDTEPCHFGFGSTNGSRSDACRPLSWSDVGKHRLFSNPEKRGATSVGGLAAAQDKRGQRSAAGRCGPGACARTASATTSSLATHTAASSPQRPWRSRCWS